MTIMRIVDIDYAARLPMYLTVEFCGQRHRLQLDVLEASKLKSFMRTAQKESQSNPPKQEDQPPLFLGIIPRGESAPIPYDEWLEKTKHEKDV